VLSFAAAAIGRPLTVVSCRETSQKSLKDSPPRRSSAAAAAAAAFRYATSRDDDAAAIEQKQRFLLK